MNKSRLLVSILLIILVASIIGAFTFGHLRYARFFERPRRSSAPILTMDLDQYPPYVTSPVVTFSGSVSQDARIEVSRDGSPLGRVFSSGRSFSTEVELKPGENHIKFLAQRNDADIDQPGTERIVDITWEPKTPPAPIINSLPRITNLPLVIIAGTTYPNGRVEIMISPDVAEALKNPPSGRPNSNSSTQAETKTWPNVELLAPIKGPQTADNSGAFQTNIRIHAAGPYIVTAVAYNSKGVASKTASDQKFLYDPDWYPPLSLAESSIPSKRIIRKANIVLTHKQMAMTLQVTLPQDDPAVKALLTNEITTESFFDNLFELEINKTHYVGEFDNVVPQIVIRDHDATITATTAPYRTVRSYLPVLHGEFVLRGRRNFPFSDSQDSLSITTRDYAIESVSPSPTLFEKSTLTWTGNNTTSLHEDQNFRSGAIKLQLAYKPFASPRNFLRLTQISPYDFWKYPGSTIPQLLTGLCSLIPMLWVLWLLQDSQIGRVIDSSLRDDVARLAKTLITLSLVDTVLDISWGLAYLAFGLRFVWYTSSSSDPTLHLLANGAILLLAFLCQLAARASRRTWGIWASRISRGFLNAALICLILDLNYFVARDVVPPAIIASLTITLGSLYFFFFRIGKVLKHGGLVPQYRRLLLLFAVIASLTVLLPGFFLGPRSGPRSMVSQSFSILHSFLPCALAIGLLIVLKTIKSSDRPTRLLVLCTGLILFSGILVGPTSTLFMIPIPFIISIWMFRRFLIHDVRNCADLDFVNHEVVTDRKGLIDRVLAYETAQHFQADIEKLKDKVSSGDMTLKDFEDRKVEIERYAYDKELASTHVNGLRAKTTVLSIGPNTDDWMNGRWCLKWGAALIAPFLLIYLLLLVFRSTYSTFGFTLALNQVLTFLSDWLIAAFFFGYYFRYIRGDSGLQKGLRIACAMIICLLPAWLTHVSSKTDLVGVFFRGGQTFLFFTLLGMAVFDYATFRNALRGQFRWGTFARFGDMPSFTAVVSVLITTLGVGLTTVLTGQFKDLLAKLINAAFQQNPGPPL